MVEYIKKLKNVIQWYNVKACDKNYGLFKDTHTHIYTYIMELGIKTGVINTILRGGGSSLGKAGNTKGI